jgi:hypothetical protein
MRLNLWVALVFPILASATKETRLVTPWFSQVVPTVTQTVTQTMTPACDPQSPVFNGQECSDERPLDG